jgi:hypothetical protein
MRSSERSYRGKEAWNNATTVEGLGGLTFHTMPKSRQGAGAGTLFCGARTGPFEANELLKQVKPEWSPNSVAVAVRRVPSTLLFDEFDIGRRSTRAQPYPSKIFSRLLKARSDSASLETNITSAVTSERFSLLV